MKSLKKIAKFSGIFIAGIYFEKLSNKNHINLHDNLDAKSEKIVEYLKQHNFIYPKIYDKYLNMWDKDHFLEKLILKDSSGLPHYKIFLPQEFIDILFEESNLSTEEKLKLCKMSCVFIAGSQVQSHKDIVHGGFQATMIDNLYGYLGTLANDLKPCATANLSLNYKKPVKVGEEYIIKVKVSKIDGRKVHITSTVEDHMGVVYTESNALMISVNWGASSWKKLFKTLHQVSKLGEAPQQDLLHLQDSLIVQHPEQALDKQYFQLTRPVSSLFDEFII